MFDIIQSFVFDIAGWLWEKQKCIQKKISQNAHLKLIIKNRYSKYFLELVLGQFPSGQLPPAQLLPMTITPRTITT